MNNNVSSPAKHVTIAMVNESDSSTSSALISWTETGSNKLKACELVTRGLDVKLDLKGENFTEWFEAVATHARTMSMLPLFECGPESNISSPVHGLHAVKKCFFESCGVVPLDDVQTLSASIATATGSNCSKIRHMDECWHKFDFNSSSGKTQKHMPQAVKTHKRSGIAELKIAVRKDAKAAHLAKNDPQNAHLKEFDCCVSKAVEKVRKLVVALEANDFLSNTHVDDVIAVFKDKTCCEDFRLQLKMLKMEKLKGSKIDIKLTLTEL